MDEQRRLLAELLGTSSHGIASYRDDRVCKRFLAGLCPATLLVKAKEFHHIVGFCDLIHDEVHKREYEAESESVKESLGYSRILERELDICVGKCNQAISRQRAARSDVDENISSSYFNVGQGRFAVLPDVAIAAKAELDKLPFIAEAKSAASELFVQANAAGLKGQVKLSQQLADEALEVLRTNSERMQALWTAATKDAVFISAMELSNARRQMREHHKQQGLVACEDCGCLLGLFDSDDRLAEHFSGRVHLSWLAIRNMWRELKGGGGGGGGRRGAREWDQREGFNAAPRSRSRERDRVLYRDAREERR
jgi:hypothetical protein